MDPTIAIKECRRFLVLLITGVGPLTPAKLVDEFWRQHVLDRCHYTDFCSRIAGRYPHHILHDEKQHGFHAPAFRRTQALYEKTFGLNPPSWVWTHMGESGGCDACSSEPNPLYIIDQPGEMCAVLRIGKIKLRHFRTFHPILANDRLPLKLWLEMIHDVNAIPQLSWLHFSATESIALLASLEWSWLSPAGRGATLILCERQKSFLITILCSFPMEQNSRCIAMASRFLSWRVLSRMDWRLLPRPAP
jgi:hypothetical protein